MIIVLNAEVFGLIGENSTKSLSAVSATLLMHHRSSLSRDPDAMTSMLSAMAAIHLDEVDFSRTYLTENSQNFVCVFSCTDAVV